MKNKKIKIKDKEYNIKITKKDIITQENIISNNDYGINHVSSSMLASFVSNPILFKIKYINKENIDTLNGISMLVGRAYHLFMEYLYSQAGELRTYKEYTKNKTAIIEGARILANDYLEKVEDGYIDYSSTIDTKEKAIFILNNLINHYLNEVNVENEVKKLISIEEEINAVVSGIEYKGKIIELPVPLKGRLDKLKRDDDGRLFIEDDKTKSVYTGEDELNARYIIQAIQYYLLVYAKYGEPPSYMVYKEIKNAKNKDGSSQIKPYIIDYSNDIYFDFYFRLYEDFLKSLKGEHSWVPNIDATFDRDIGIIAYAGYLDKEDIEGKVSRNSIISNINDYVAKAIVNKKEEDKFKKLLENTTKEYTSIDYTNMKIEEQIKTKLLHFGINLNYVKVIEGNSVNTYCYEPAIGVKMNSLFYYKKDIEQMTEKTNIRIVAPIPNTKYIGIEIPKDARTFEANTSQHEFGFINVGKDVYCKDIKLEIEDMPHLLIAGTTGSGKSVLLKNIIKELESSDRYELIKIDPKGNELGESSYTDYEEILNKLKYLIVEMDNRYKIMKNKGISKWDGNKIIIIIDEYADICGATKKVITGSKQVTKIFAKGAVSIEEPEYGKAGEVISDIIQKLSQKSRAAGIHIILATQRPSVKIINGDIKANFPTRISGRLPSVTDSKVILDKEGAEALQGKGDMLLLKNGELIRFQSYL